ncbi:glycosyl hydrolase family 3 N terminal domain-containing protein [Eubacterium sp. CAG:274]|nr:glycosyl hydrolase family 3 N terminal domain-containing protein [Eubacterium sp. CAG:274]
MKTFIRLFSVLLSIMLFCTGCGVSKENSKSDTVENKEPTVDEKVEKIVNNMTLEEKVGQIFMVAPEAVDKDGGSTTVFTENIEKEIEKYNLGGYILFASNIENPTQTQELINGLKKSSKIQPFVGVDEEGGRVARIGKNSAMGVEKIEPMAQVGKSQNYERANEIGTTIGKYIKNLGFNLDFAPDTDVLTDSNNTEIGDRSFGNDPEVVGKMATEVVKGLQSENISTVLKHFPGHGGSIGNSHQGFSLSNRTEEELKKCEIVPFKTAIENGADCVMVAHMSLPNVTGDNITATLSKKVVTDMLKTELNFKGVVFSDSMSMGAITENYGTGDACVKAVEAGIDMVLMPENLDEAYNAVLEAVKNGKISQERLDDAVSRIIKAKIQRGIIK